MKTKDQVPASGSSMISRGIIMIVVAGVFLVTTLLTPVQTEAAVSWRDTFPGSPQMPNSTASSQTYNYTPSAGSNRIIVISVHAFPNNTNGQTITIDYGSGTDVGTKIVDSETSSAGNRRYAGLFYLDENDIAVASGSNYNLTVNVSNTNGQWHAWIGTLQGVDQSSVINSVYDTYANSGAYQPATALNANDGGLGIFALTHANSDTGISVTETYSVDGPTLVGTASAYKGSKVISPGGTTQPTVTITSGWGGFAVATINPTTVAVAGITISPTSGLVTTEAGGTAAFTIVLKTQPTASVTIGLSSSDTTEGTVSPSSVTFTTADWNTPQTVTVTGADDAGIDGNIAYTIVTAAATSGDGTYNGMNAADVSVTNDDNDAPAQVPAGNFGVLAAVASGIFIYGIWKVRSNRGNL